MSGTKRVDGEASTNFDIVSRARSPRQRAVSFKQPKPCRKPSSPKIVSCRSTFPGSRHHLSALPSTLGHPPNGNKKIKNQTNRIQSKQHNRRRPHQRHDHILRTFPLPNLNPLTRRIQPPRIIIQRQIVLLIIPARARRTGARRRATWAAGRRGARGSCGHGHDGGRGH